jgi:hypothetical protein
METVGSCETLVPIDQNAWRYQKTVILTCQICTLTYYATNIDRLLVASKLYRYLKHQIHHIIHCCMILVNTCRFCDYNVCLV